MSWRDTIEAFEREHPADASSATVSQNGDGSGAKLALEMVEKYGPYWDQPEFWHLDPRLHLGCL